MRREEIEKIIENGLEKADEAVQQAWQAVSIELSKWICPSAAEQEAFWAVAIIDKQVVWYNHVEHGFNISPFSELGVIDQYWCNQDEFESVLQRLPEAQMAERFAALNPELEIPAGLQCPGEIVRRQTTYWDLRSESGSRWRVHFSGKREIRYSAACYNEMTLESQHPLLAHYSQLWETLFISNSASEPRQLANLLDECAQALTHGWRRLAEYSNPAVNPADLLSIGHGLLLSGPVSLVDATASVLDANHVKFTRIASHARNESLLVLEVGLQNAIVAESFSFEKIPRADG